MNCKNFKTRKKNNKREQRIYNYCIVKRKEITYDDCKGCEFKEFKQTLCKKTAQKSIKFKKNINLSKLERNRFSLFTDDLDHCIICGAKRDNLHEVFPGAFRQRSIKEHMVLPLCFFHHTQIHKDTELSLNWKRLCQQKFEESHARDEFIKIFGRSYLQ